MPTAVASAIAPQIPQVHSTHDISPKPSYPALAPGPGSDRKSASTGPSQPGPTPAEAPPAAVGVAPASQQLKTSPDGKRSSPQSNRNAPPKIIVKKEHIPSPEVPATARHRPRKLDLTSSTASSAGASIPSRPSAPLTARDSATLGMHDVGLACLSPGFQTQDPSMREQLQRSISVRDQQRHIIESRLQKNAKNSDSSGGGGSGPGGDRADGGSGPHFGGLKTPMTSKRRPPPAGLVIVPPPHADFTNERVIQSAPLNQTFTGRHQPHPPTRHTANGPTSTLAQHSHIHNHVQQTQNRLPPITDVFANEGLGIRDGGGSGGASTTASRAQQESESRANPQRPGLYHSASAHAPSSRAAYPNSPGFPPPPGSASHPQSQQSRGPPPGSSSSSSHPPPSREYRSAEEAVAEMASGREDLLPKIVHYSSNGGSGSHQPHQTQQQQQAYHGSSSQPLQQPPTPPSPPPGPAPGATHPKMHHGYPGPAGSNAGGGSGTPGSSSGGPIGASGSRRRPRSEYERDMGTPPLPSGPSPRARLPFGAPPPGPGTAQGAPPPTHAAPLSSHGGSQQAQVGVNGQIPAPPYSGEAPVPKDVRGPDPGFGFRDIYASGGGSSGGRDGGLYSRDRERDRDRESPDAARRKKEEFLNLCSRAWDLLHS